MATTDEYWDWQGTPLNQPWYNITTFGGSRWDLPLLRGQNYPIAYRAGQMWRPKMPDQRTVTLAMWAAGVDQNTGNPATDQRLAFNNNFQQLRSMFSAQGLQGSSLGALTRRWYITQNGVTGLVAGTAQAEIGGAMTPTMSGRTKADFTVDLLLADPYFYGAQQVVTVPYNTATAIRNLGDGWCGFGQLSGLGGVPFTIKLNGPLTSPIQLSNQTLGVSVSLALTIASGHYVLLDVMGYTAYDDGSLSHLGVVTHSGARPWMLLQSGLNTLLLTSGNGGDTGNAVVTFSPPYL